WTLIHRLDEKSPLFGLSPENTGERVIGIILSFTGVDDTLLQPVHARQLYNPEDLRFGARFADMIEPSEPGMLRIDHSKMDELVVDDTPGPDTA
ncbi:MAG TPA: hypothetical protein VNG33_16615, partial [Polyangiaceae bacterium]|nr:hypothetical protein [Polyangiaceae bacterium]